MEKDYINGMIKGFIKGSGNIIKWMEKENLYGLMAGNILVNTKQIKKMVLGFLNGNFY